MCLTWLYIADAVFGVRVWCLASAMARGLSTLVWPAGSSVMAFGQYDNCSAGVLV
jgi:hypothetical protein